jgi:hypothetical protein
LAEIAKLQKVMLASFTPPNINLKTFRVLFIKKIGTNLDAGSLMDGF